VITFVIGGTRSGKSEVAEQIAAGFGSTVTVIVPGLPTDPAMAARIAEHQARRPAEWATIECGHDLVGALTETSGVVLIDSLGSWVAATRDLHVDADALVGAVTGRDDPTVVVSEEVGLSVHPTTDAGRTFADVLGRLNARLSAVADTAHLVVAGRTVRLGAVGE
jgi:adenosyl cobinamide kinase/adenosyl cobinamide phosphate guanylyltransferase